MDISVPFFLVIAPGFEAEALAELHQWCPEVTATSVHGGVEFSAPLAVGYGLNRVMKIPTRILVRLADYGCRDFPKLYKKFAGFAWDQWIRDDAVVEFDASTTNSRLRMKKRIESTCADGRAAYLKKKGVKSGSGPAARVLVRFEDDVCWVSLDTSGEILHKRGLRPLSAVAPLRETTAAGLLQYLKSFGSAERVTLVDPMTGGGTFLLEAAGQRSVVTSREFAFEKFAKPEASSFASATSRYSVFIGFESDARVLEAARENLAGIANVKFVEADFFEAETLAASEEPRWLIANPPYGERIRIEGSLVEYYEKLFAAAERVVRPDRALFVIPEKVRPARLRLPSGWRRLGSKPFSNGGVAVEALVFGRTTSV